MMNRIVLALSALAVVATLTSTADARIFPPGPGMIRRSEIIVTGTVRRVFRSHRRWTQVIAELEVEDQLKGPTLGIPFLFFRAGWYEEGRNTATEGERVLLFLSSAHFPPSVISPALAGHPIFEIELQGAGNFSLHKSGGDDYVSMGGAWRVAENLPFYCLHSHPLDSWVAVRDLKAFIKSGDAVAGPPR